MGSHFRVDEVIEEFQAGGIRLEFPKMTVVRAGLADPKASHEGSGEIWQDDLGHLHGKLLVPNYRSLQGEGPIGFARIGELMTEDAYYDLRGVDIAGRRWKSERVEVCW